MKAFSDEQYVVRGGESKPDDLKENLKRDKERRLISARSAAKMEFRQLAHYPPRFVNGKFTYTTVGGIRGLGKDWDVIDDPSPNNMVPLHVGIRCPNSELSDEEAHALHKVFIAEEYPEGRIKNYARGKK